jgi:hypothetical protein
MCVVVSAGYPRDEQGRLGNSDVFVYTRTGSPRVTLGTNRAFVRNAARLFEFDQNGKYIREIGQGLYGFVFAHAVRVDRQDNIWVKTQFTNAGAPYAICISPGSRQFLYTSNSNPSTGMENGEIYKMTLDGKILGKFGTAGKLLKEFGTVHEMDCRSENELYVGEITNWRVQKLTLKPTQSN